MQQRHIGDRLVSAIGLGALPMSVDGRPDEAQSIATIHAALDAGVTLIDTADAYHPTGAPPGHNERLVAKALRTWPDAGSVLVATKGGYVRSASGAWIENGTPEHLRQAARASAVALEVDAIGLYYLHSPDSRVPFAESVGALADLLADGVIERAGISNVTCAQIEEANALLDGRLAAVQNQFSPGHRDTRDTLSLCAELGIAFVPWSPLGGIGGAKTLGGAAAGFIKVASAHAVSPQQVALAWELAQAPVVIPIPGASRPSSIRDSAAAADLTLAADEVALLDV